MYKPFLLCVLMCLPSPALADMKTAQDLFNRAEFQAAVPHLEEAAGASNAQAELLLGTIYDLGLGTAKNPYRAFDYYLRAATKSHPVAQMRLANLYLNGTSLPAPDPLRAFLWFQLATLGDAPNAAQMALKTRQMLSATDLQNALLLLADYQSQLYPNAFQ